MHVTLTIKQYYRLVILTIIILLLTACSDLWNIGNYKKRQGSASSLVEYLYPDGRIPPGIMEKIPQIKVPMSLGIAFVPNHSYNRSSYSLTEAHKNALLEKIKKQFISRPEIQAIKIIPSHYLIRKGGYNDLRRIAALYGVEQVALVSYDQTAFIHHNPLSLTYWTIVGAYIIPGNSHNLQTFVDIAVIDVRTTKLILRAAGQHSIKHVSTAVAQRASFRKISQKSFTEAVQLMSTNLDTALEEFKVRLRQGSKEAKITYAPGYSGNTDLIFLLLIICTALLITYRKNNKDCV